MSISTVFFYIMLLTVIIPVSAFAYLDPATGSYIVQIVIASILTSLFVIKHYWKKIKSKVMMLFNKGEDKQES